MASKNFELEMRILDPEVGGIFPELKRSTVPEFSFLIISYGGTGSDALEVIKNNLERNVEEKQRAQFIRLLAIDTDKNTQFKNGTTKKVGTASVRPIKRFEDSEFFWLNNAPAQSAIKLYNSDKAMQEWINPELTKTIQADQGLLDGSGAASTRQLGRLLLYPQQTVNALQAKIMTLVGQITNGNANKLKVFIVSGISGGTGSGIVIDATYLIRSFIDGMPGSMGARTEYCGFLLLPPTGTSVDATNISKGDRNGIAALKEIDHFMTIANRDEVYRMNFGGKQVVSKERIFKTCYLVDGVLTGMGLQSPREKANEVLSDCILDMMTSQPVAAKAGVTLQTVDSFMSDAAAYARHMVSLTSEHLAPRDANFVYCAIGHGKTLIPIALLRAYVAKEVFDAVYNKLLKSSGVQEKDAIDFVKTVWSKPFNARQQRGDIFSEINKCFGDLNQGPFYAVNLLKCISEYAGKMYKTTEGSALAIGKANKLDNYANIQKEALALNKQYFDTYVMVLEEMRKYLTDQHDIICKSELLEKYGGSTYTFTPIDFGKGDAAAELVRKYLDTLVNTPKIKGQIAKGLLKEMAEKRDEWTELSTTDPTANPRFNAPARIRLFWQEQMDKLVSATLEDFLIKYYSGDPDAQYVEIQTENGPAPSPASAAALQQAAQAIVAQMWGDAGMANPMAELMVGIMPAQSFNAHYYCLVPQSAPHLRAAIEAELAARGINNVDVNESFADDRLSCYAQFTGLPAYMFAWTVRAEPDYEAALKTAAIGLHMSETKGGERWQNYPNLLVEGIWDKLGSIPYSNPREKAIGERAKDIFTRADELGLTLEKALAVNANVQYYTVFTLPEALRPNELFFKDVDTETPGSAAYAAAQSDLDKAVEDNALKLFKLVDWAAVNKVDKSGVMNALKDLPAEGSKVAFNEQALNFVNTVMTPDPAQPIPKGWEEKLAAQLLRTSPQLMYDVRGSVLVLERLYEMIQKAQRAKLIRCAFAHFLAADLFVYDANLLQWVYNDGLQDNVLWEMDFGVDTQEYAKYYFLYEEFGKHFNMAFLPLKQSYDNLKQGNNRQETIQKLQQLKAKAQAYADEVARAITADRTNPKQESILTSQAFREKTEILGYDTDAIIAFYQALKNELATVPFPGF